MQKILRMVFFSALAVAGCSDSESPEAQVHAVIAGMERAAEARDVGELMQYVSQDYRDASGQNPADASRYVRGYFLANQSLHLLTRIEALEFPSEREAQATVLVGMVSRDADSSGAWDLAADVYEFDIALVREEGDWKVTHAQWRRR